MCSISLFPLLASIYSGVANNIILWHHPIAYWRTIIYHHLILDMATAVIYALNLNTEQSTAVEKAITANWQDKIAIVWSIEDIQIAAEEKHHCRLLEEDAARIHDSLLENHDAELGVTWDTIHWCIDKAIEIGIDTIPMTEEVDCETQII